MKGRFFGLIMLLFGMLLFAPSTGASLGEIPDDPVGIEYTDMLDAETVDTEIIYEVVDVGKQMTATLSEDIFIQNQCNLQFSLEVDRFQTTSLYWEKRVKENYLCEDGTKQLKHRKYRYIGDMPPVLRL